MKLKEWDIGFSGVFCVLRDLDDIGMELDGIMVWVERGIFSGSFWEGLEMMKWG